MTIVRFNDGVSIETGGPLRKFELRDGWYVTGEEKLIPCDSEEEADEIIKREKILKNKVISFPKFKRK